MRIGVLFALIGALGRPAPAQGPATEADDSPRPATARPIVGRDRLKSVSLADLIDNAVVARELGLDPARLAAMDEAAAAAASDPTVARLRNRARDVTTWHASGRAAQAEVDRAHAALAEAMTRRDEAVVGLLTEVELRRLRQVRLQRLGPRGMALPDVADSLRLADEQRARVRAILDGREASRAAIVARHKAAMPDLDRRYDQASRRLVAARAPVPGDEDFWRRFWAYHAALGRDLDAFEDDVDARLLALLTPLQRKHYELLLGAPLDIDPPAPAPPPGQATGPSPR